MHTATAHSLLRLIAQQNGQDFDAWVLHLRNAGASWRTVSNLIADEYGRSVSVWTLARWFSEDRAAA